MSGMDAVQNAEGLKIGIFGGSFDPPHQGHAAIAQACIAQLQLDELIIIPTRSAWYKNRALSDAQHRLQCCRYAFGDIQHAQISTLELDTDGANYTIDTVHRLQARYPATTTWYLVLGGDQMSSLHEWQGSDELMAMLHIVLAQRPGVQLDTAARERAAHNQSRCAHFHALRARIPDISSTQLRSALAQTPTPSIVDNYLHPAVLRYIREYQLYF